MAKYLDGTGLGKLWATATGAFIQKNGGGLLSNGSTIGGANLNICGNGMDMYLGNTSNDEYIHIIEDTKIWQNLYFLDKSSNSDPEANPGALINYNGTNNYLNIWAEGRKVQIGQGLYVDGLADGFSINNCNPTINSINSSTGTHTYGLWFYRPSAPGAQGDYSTTIKLVPGWDGGFTGTYTLTLPARNGTLALASDLHSHSSSNSLSCSGLNVYNYIDFAAVAARIDTLRIKTQLMTSGAYTMNETSDPSIYINYSSSAKILDLSSGSATNFGDGRIIFLFRAGTGKITITTNAAHPIVYVQDAPTVTTSSNLSDAHFAILVYSATATATYSNTTRTGVWFFKWIS